jgi:hypothetical protein
MQWWATEVDGISTRLRSENELNRITRGGGIEGSKVGLFNNKYRAVLDEDTVSANELAATVTSPPTTTERVRRS